MADPDIEIVIRAAKPEHVEGIAQCARAAYQGYVSRIGREPAPMVADFTASVREGHAYVALDPDGSVCGFAVFYPRGDHIHLENIAVAPAFQGHGIGKLLMCHCEQSALALGCGAIELYTNEKMTENLKLYPALGYAEIGRRQEDGFNRVYFRKIVRDTARTDPGV